METRVGAQLMRQTTDLDIDHGFARLYSASVYRASELWDQLVMRLPDARGKELDELHESIELIHLILLQGLADLDYLKAKAERLASEVENQQTELLDDLQVKFAPVAVAGAPRTNAPLQDSLLSGGYVAPTAAWARAVAAATSATHNSYVALLEAISKAFDERRVRETDKIAKWAPALAVTLAGVPLITEAYGKLISNVWTWAAALLFLLPAVVLGGVGGYVYLRRGRLLGQLKTSKNFQDDYQQVRDFLALCRTENLERIRQELSVERAQQENAGMDALRAAAIYFDQWDAIDRKLAHDLACLVERLNKHLPSAPAARSDARKRLKPRDGTTTESLKQSVETWALFSMLANERPREFLLFPLPRLMLLYRAYPIIPPQVSLREGSERAPRLVSDAELRVTLRVFCSARIEDVEAFDERVCHLAHSSTGRSSARRFLDILDREIGIRAGMAEGDWVVANARIRSIGGL
ncbi:hypothetical protein PHK61_31305 [Actinomycetospora lutea]|uniref:hypothetical protein n=1 Tax=Actinomycetospora lutea TaxID=663604 RepID=UPI002366A0F6|nr:hypothetical protein [Actinomycetospora lutea]MDD7942907.1 hypothetical protein [Actinomycetospora lutea]